MNLKRLNWRWMAAIGFALAFLMLCGIVACTDAGYRTYGHLESSRLVFKQGTELEGMPVGIMNSGPAISGGGGRMVLSWDIESDAENVIHVRATNNAVIEPSEIAIQAGHSQGTVELYSLDEIYDLQVLVDYRDGSYIRVNQIDLTVRKAMDRFFTAGFLLLSGAVLSALWACGFLNEGRRGEMVILLAAVLIASIPDLRGHLHTGHDSEFHMGRLLNLVHAIRDGQIPARVGGYMQNGYGTVVSVYYPELFMYIPALMIIAGASFNYSYHIFFILMHLTAAISMRYAAGRIFKSSAAGVTGSVLYTLAQYRIVDIYTRFAIGESIVMSILPLFALGLYEVLMGDQRKWRLLAVSATMICQSHLISTSLCGVISVCLALAFSVKIIREGRLVPLLKAVVFAVLLNLFFFLPLYTYSQQDVVTSWMRRDLNATAMTPAQIFLEPIYVMNVDDDGLHNYPLGLGLPLILMAAAALYAALTQKKWEKRDVIAMFLCVAGVGFALMSTNVFPWGKAVSLTHGAAEYIQFPWRLLMLSSVCFALAGGYAVSRTAEYHHVVLQFAVLCLCAVCILPLVSEETRKENYLPKGELPYWDVRFGDYALPGADLRALNERNPVAAPGIEVSSF